jgi:hypothetical protein
MEMTAFQRRVAIAAASLAAVTAMSAAVASPASANPTGPDTPSGGQYWGSIANSHRFDDAGYPQIGGYVNARTKADAEAEAISACGQSDCKTFLDFQECAVAAWDARNEVLVAGRGPTLKAAIRAAAKGLDPGGKAKILGQGCNKGSG